MKNNNRGFLVTGMLYSLLLLFLVLMIGMLAIMNARQNKLNYISRNIITKLNDKYTFDVARQWEFDYTGNYQTFTVPTDGYYNIELWGAQGGNMTGTGVKSDGSSRGSLSYTGGKGAYTKGVIYLTKGETIYIYVGGKGADNVSLGNCPGGDAGGYNGGGSLKQGQCVFGASGGGATDIRLTSGEWNNFGSLKSRIMVAAGGGGANFRNQGYGEGNGGAGGTLYGVNGSEALTEGSYFRSDYAPGYGIGTGGTQTAGGYESGHLLNGTIVETKGSAHLGSFGYAASENQSGGGSGYYGGGSDGHGGAGGGSSFISGYYGADAISESSIEGDIIHTGQSKHYSGKVFYNGMMIAGDASMPTHAGSSTMTGNEGNGYAKISLLSTTPIAYTTTNMIKNGSFEDGLTNWSIPSNFAASTITSDVVYTGKNSIQYSSGNVMLNQVLSVKRPVYGHKYYGFTMFKSSPKFTVADSRYEWYYTDANDGTFIFGFKGATDGWKKYSSLLTLGSSQYISNNEQWMIRNFLINANEVSYLDDMLIVDLTETFGAGNEPSKEWCDQNISYFDGTITIYK